MVARWLLKFQTSCPYMIYLKVEERSSLSMDLFLRSRKLFPKVSPEKLVPHSHQIRISHELIPLLTLVKVSEDFSIERCVMGCVNFRGGEG
jgi:hypothetical protein